MTTPGDIRDAVGAALMGQTMVGERVYTPRDWDTFDGQLPVILVRGPTTDRESLGRGQPQFTATATVQVVGRLEIAADSTDAAAMVGENQLETLEAQILRAVINYPPLMAALQQHPFIHSRMGFSAAGEQHLAELVLEIGCEFYQGPEDFYPIPTVQLQDVRLNDPAVFPGLAPPSVEADAPIPQP